MNETIRQVAVADDLAAKEQFVSVVLAHANDTLRSLPWRDTRDPWAVCVSEVMLQQTQVARVVPYFQRFMAAFPSAHACANASQAAVVTAFSGLGYNRRAVYLHRTAVAVANTHGGVFPDTLSGLLALPGVGPYTARALLAFAFERDVAVVDTNVSRVIARALVGAPVGARDVQAHADQLVPKGQGWLWNQGMLDFAATICTKRAPGCNRCPFVSQCVWQSTTANGPDPADGSAFVTVAQTPFAGSDRQGRGRVIAALADGPRSYGELAQITGWHDTPDRIERMVSGLVRDGLVTRHGDSLELMT
ncbi:MAG: hypothetical protein WD360_02540 [Nitriliruptoraceae bacterium]